MTIWRRVTQTLADGRAQEGPLLPADQGRPCCGELLSGLGEPTGHCCDLGAFVYALEERSDTDRDAPARGKGAAQAG